MPWLSDPEPSRALSIIPQKLRQIPDDTLALPDHNSAAKVEKKARVMPRQALQHSHPNRPFVVHWADTPPKLAGSTFTQACVAHRGRLRHHAVLVTTRLYVPEVSSPTVHDSSIWHVVHDEARQIAEKAVKQCSLGVQ